MFEKIGVKDNVDFYELLSSNMRKVILGSILVSFLK